MTDLAAPRHDWQLRTAPKHAPYGVVRTVPPSDTIRRVTPMLALAGVTRVADVTGLDRVGIPNFTTVRPRERGEGLSYYNGKGVTRAAAHAGALMEAIERFSGERCDLPVRYATYAEALRHGAAIDPASIIVPQVTDFHPDLRLEWVEGFDLQSGSPTLVPLNAVVVPYEPPEGRTVLYETGTNGLASGNTLEEALCHALCEVIERDATAVSDACIDLVPAVSRVLQGLGLSPSDPAHGHGRFPLIDLQTLPRRARVLATKLQRAGLQVYLRDVTSTGGIATLDCVIVEWRHDGHHVSHGGTGTHPDARVAASRALTEAAQSRVGHIQGGREDLHRIVRDTGAFDPEHLFGRGAIIPFSAVATREHTTVDEDIRFMLQRLKDDGFAHVVAVDLTRPELGIPVVRIIVPGAEAWSVYVTHGRRGRFGERIARLLHDGMRSRTEPTPSAAP